MWKWQMNLGLVECLVVGQARLSGGNSLRINTALHSFCGGGIIGNRRDKVSRQCLKNFPQLSCS